MPSTSAPATFMAVERAITVEVVYATPAEQCVIAVRVPVGSTAREVITSSQILQRFPDIDLSVNQIGVFSRFIDLDTVVADGDRIEIYRPLTADPKAVRRRLAEQGKTMGRRK